MNSQDFRNLQESYLNVYSVDEELTGERAERAKEIMKGSRPYGRKRVSTDAKYNAAKRALTAGEGSTISPSRDVRGDEKLPTGRGGRGIKGRAKTVTQSNGSQTDRGRGNKATRRSGGDVEDTRYDESYDLYDFILSHLLDEGYADNEEAAERIMVNMSEEWRESIVEMKMDPRGRPASGPMNVYANPKGKPDQAHLDAIKSYEAAQKKKTPEQKKAELDAYRERQMNNK